MELVRAKILEGQSALTNHKKSKFCNLKQANNMSLQIPLLPTICCFLLASSIFSQSSYATPNDDLLIAISRLALVNEIGEAQFYRLKSFPEDVVPLLTQALQNSTDAAMEARYISFLVVKLDQFQTELSQTAKDASIEAIVHNCERSQESDLITKLRIIENMHDVRIDQMAIRLQSNTDPITKWAATEFITKRAAKR